MRAFRNTFLFLFTHVILRCLSFTQLPARHLRQYKNQFQLKSSPNKNPNPKKDETVAAVTDALRGVGWSGPTSTSTSTSNSNSNSNNNNPSPDLSSNDPFVQAINDSIINKMGVPLDELINPAKVVNLERDLVNLRLSLASLTNINVSVEDADRIALRNLRSDEFDGGGGGEKADKIRKQISKKEDQLFDESKAVFKGWLKNVFLGQAVLSLAVSWIMVSDPALLFGKLGVWESLELETPIRVLGFWWWWLFIVPSLRSRRPRGAEKEALDIAFLGTPLISLVAPAITKNCEAIWFLNFAVVAGSFAFVKIKERADGEGEEKKEKNEFTDFIYKSLDFGSGQERGAREFRIEEQLGLEQSEKTKRVLKEKTAEKAEAEEKAEADETSGI